MNLYDVSIYCARETSKAIDVEQGTHSDARREALCVSTVDEGDQEGQRLHGLRSIMSLGKRVLETTAEGSSSRCLLLSGDCLDDVSNKPVIASELLLVSKPGVVVNCDWGCVREAVSLPLARASRQSLIRWSSCNPLTLHISPAIATPIGMSG